MPDTFTTLHRAKITTLANQYALPTDRMLKGEKPSELPVQAPAKFQLVINLTAAKAIGLHISEAFLVRADEVID
jgi:putative ABC transport system substrate-binding protein